MLTHQSLIVSLLVARNIWLMSVIRLHFSQLG